MGLFSSEKSSFPTKCFFMKLALFFLSILSLSQAANLARLAHAPPELIGSFRLLGASLIMGTLLFFQKKNNPKEPIKKILTPHRPLFFAIASGFFFFVHLWTYKFAAQNTTIANTMILFALNPLVTAFFTTFIFKQHYTRRLWLSNVLALLGVFILVGNQFQSFSIGALGPSSALISAFFYSFYLLTGRESRKIISNSQYTFIVYSVACAFFFLTAFIRNTISFNYPFETWMSILGLILFPTLLGHALFTYLLQTFDINWMSTGKLSEPIFASITAAILFQETWTERTSIAFLFTCSSLVILLKPWRHFGTHKSTESGH